MSKKRGSGNEQSKEKTNDMKKKQQQQQQAKDEKKQDTPEGPKKQDAVRALSLEAIFHPKFENENRAHQDVRQQMKDRVGSQQGYLEVSLKHSGSLLLWSGHQRYYSKNSSENCFTYVGEMLLRQHFWRAWPEQQQQQQQQDGNEDNQEGKYRECSDFVEDNRYTLAFEVVTSVLGHHGDLPSRDFLILTAVADREAERFLTTAEILEFAQRFRLPHNDVWVCSTNKAVDELFHLYDSKRETGYADDMIAALDETSDAHVSSMYPHVDFQGNILEGVVIRYVSYPKNGQDGNAMEKLAERSREILQSVPPSAPSSFDVVTKPPVLATNVRKLRAKLTEDGCNHSNVLNRIGEAVFATLEQSETTQSSDRNPKQTPSTPKRRSALKENKKDWDIPRLARSLLARDDVDDETKRIATVIRNADRLSSRVDYVVFRENETRWLCIIHVMFDQTFKRYQQKMQEDDMHLFRGFCVEMHTDDSTNKKTTNGNGHTDKDVVMKDSNDATEYNESAYLMLKMKMLPYMVRTFGCRNGLKVIDKGGAREFAKYTAKLLRMWGMSTASFAKWQPFFQAWGAYVEAYKRKDATKQEWFDTALPPLTSDCYLDHLRHFQPMYEAGKIKASDDIGAGSTYRALIVVVALKKETSDRVAKYISQHFGGLPRISDGNELSEEALLTMKTPVGGGLLWATTVDGGFGPLRRHLNKHGKSISIVMYGCEEENILESFPPQDVAKMTGMTKGWAKCRCQEVIALPLSSLTGDATNNADNQSADNGTPSLPSGFIASEEFVAALAKLQAVSDRTEAIETNPGALVFFPAIPGCGKSTISSDQTIVELSKRLQEVNEAGGGAKRRVVSLMGDKVKKKYWQRVKGDRLAESSCLFIADKNAPPSSWTMVGESTGRGWAIPVVVDPQALQTTTIDGTIFPNSPDGQVDTNTSHFYPFSLQFLAVCILRVLERPANSHPGKLDGNNELSGLVVVKFFGLYRFLSAEEFRESLTQRLNTGGALTPVNPIEIPFFKETHGPDGGTTGALPPLPNDLYETLVEAIRLQFGYDLKNRDTTRGKDPKVSVMADKLRTSILRHKDFLESLTVDPETTRTAFVEQVAQHMTELDEAEANGLEHSDPMDIDESSNTRTVATKASTTTTIDPASAKKKTQRSEKYIRLASIDVDKVNVHNMVLSCAKQQLEVQNFLKSIGVSPNDTVPFLAKEFVVSTHVTMAHPSEQKQESMRSMYGALVGLSIDLHVTGLLWNEHIAALAVEVPAYTIDAGEEPKPIPRGKNEFMHITLWHDSTTKAYQSNKLPGLVKKKQAQQLVFDTKFTLRGVFHFW